MRDDNVVDYPWLLFSLSTLIDEYARIDEASEHGLHRDRIVEALVNGLSADVDAFLGGRRHRRSRRTATNTSALPRRSPDRRSNIVSDFERLSPGR